MADSKDEMARLARLETVVGGMASDIADLKSDVRDLKTDVRDLKTAAWRTAEILADHSERLSGLQRTMDERLGGVTDRLDRLIAVTIQERTGSSERRAGI
jgi:hypothetical protein